MKLKYKAALNMFIFGSFFIISVAFAYHYYYQGFTLKNAHRNTQHLADDAARHIEFHLEERVKIATILASAPILLQALAESNDKFAALSDGERKEKIVLLNKRWKESSDPNAPFIQDYMTNPVANFFKKQQTTFPKEYGEIFLTNRYGIIIATTNKLTTLAHVHKYWWLASYADGKGRIFFDDRGYDTSVEGYVLGIVVPVTDHGQIIGIIKCNTNIMGPLSHVLNDYTSNKPGIAKLVRSKGLIVFEQGKEPLSTTIADMLNQKLGLRQPGSSIFHGHSSKKLAAYAPVQITMGSDQYGFGGSYESIDHIKGNTGEGWHVVIIREVKEILRPLSKTIYLFEAIGGLFVLLAALVSWFWGRRISRPMMQFVRTAKKIGAGNLDSTVAITSDDEIGGLAQSFNAMVSDLKNTLISRDKLFEEIQHRKKVEESLRHSEERFRTVADFAYDWEYWIGPDEEYIYVSPSCERITGYSSSDFFNDPHLMRKIAFPEDSSLIENHFMNDLHQEEPHVIDFRIVAKDGTVRWVNHICQCVYADDGRFLGRRACNRDISERKWEERCFERLNELKGELLLQGNINDKLRLITDLIVELFKADFCRIWMVCPGDLCEAGCLHATANDPIHHCSNRDQCLHLLVSSGRYTHIDGGHQRVPFGSYKIGRIATGLEPSFLTNEVTTDPRVHNHDWAKEIGLAAFAGYRILAADGRPIGVLALFSKQLISQRENARLENIANTAASVFQLSQAIEKLEQAAKIQQVLLQEVNHRVKNNLTAIISMLHVEEDRVEGKGLTELQSRMHDIVSRVEGLLTVHRLLSASEWKPISLTTLCEEIIKGAIKGLPFHQTIALVVASANTLVRADQAHYLSIVLNELATNTLKYGLQERVTANIRVSIHPQGENVLLIYCYDGPGCPERLSNDEDLKGTTGFYRMKGIVTKSLQGKIELLNDNGANTRIIFPAMTSESE